MAHGVWRTTPRRAARWASTNPAGLAALPVGQDHSHRLETVYDERFAPTYGRWRSVVRDVADKYLACGVLDHGFARIRCDGCTHE